MRLFAYLLFVYFLFRLLLFGSYLFGGEDRIRTCIDPLRCYCLEGSSDTPQVIILLLVRLDVRQWRTRYFWR